MLENNEIYSLIKKGGIESARFEANQIIRAFSEDAERLAAAKRRVAGEPLQYILGEWEFFGLTFCLGEGVLIPRADTEILVEEAIKIIGDKPLKVLDLCSGSGEVAVAVAKNTKAYVTAIEKSEKAFEFLTKNIAKNNVSVKAVKGDIFDEFEGEYDLILSNPPYIETGVIPTLSKEVSHEPVMALDGGADGLVFYKRILSYWSTKLKSGGKIAVEIGFDQGEKVANLFSENGFSEIQQIKDYSGNQRVIIGTLNP
jgi:release factor glutamine methyltransferase